MWQWSRTRSASRGSSVASPRGTHKPSSVAPAPPRPTSRPGSLNRFGFKSGSTRVKPGDSTDSVNSILSDAHTVDSDHCDLCDLPADDDPGLGRGQGQGQGQPGHVSRSNQSLAKSECSKEFQYSKIQDCQTSKDSRFLDPQADRSPRPGSVGAGGLVSTCGSNYSSAKSSPNPSGRITATTRQLPKPQIVTVKSVNPRSYLPNFSTQTFPDTTGRFKSPRAAPRVSRDSESSYKSTTEADSGLGSSSESDRVREEAETGETGEADTDTLDSNNLEFPEDVSELWLREKRGSVLESRSGPAHTTLELAFRGSGSFEVKRKGLEVKVTGGGALKGEESASVSSVSILGSPPDRKGKGGEDDHHRHLRHHRHTANTTDKQGKVQLSESKVNIEKSPTSQTKLNSRTKSTTPPNRSPPHTTASRSPPHHTPPNRSPPHTTTSSKSPPHHSPPHKTPSHSPPHRSPPHTTTMPHKTPAHHNTTKLPPHRSPPSAHQKPPQTHTVGLVKTRVAMLETTPTAKKSPPQPPSLRRTPRKPITRPTSLEKSPSLVIPVTERNIELSKPVFRRLEYCEGSAEERHDTSNTKIEDILIVGSIETESFIDCASEKGSGQKTIERALKTSPSDDKSQCDVTKASQDAREREKVLMESSMEASLTSVTDNLTPDDSKLLTPQSESSFEILESLSETLDLTLEEPIKEDLEEGLSISESSSSMPSEIPPPRTTPVQMNRFQNAHALTHKVMISPTDRRKPLGQLLSALKTSLDSRSSLESSTESQKTDGIGTDTSSAHPPLALTNSSSGPSGTCTPILTSARDLDLDFLIDDEIADQPGLTFGGEGGAGLTSSFFGDDELEELVAAVACSGSPTHHSLPAAAAAAGEAAETHRRTRTDSLDTTSSSLAGDDLMLDYDAHESVMAAGYDEEVMSPDASEIFSEWTAMMAEMGGSERCASREGSSSSSVGGGGGGGGRLQRPRQGSLSDLVTSDARRPPMVLRPPRQGSVSESEGSCGSVGGGGSGGGGVFLDRTSYHYMYQDVTSLKTMLLRLRRVLQATDTINPFDANLRNSLYLSLASSESPGLNGDKDCLTPSPAQICQENVDLRRQVVLLQQQLEDKDRTIRLLQQQLSQSLTLTTVTPAPTTNTTTTTTAAAAATATVNAATQTDRLTRGAPLSASLSRAASIDDGLGPTVSSEIDWERGRGRSASSPAQPHRATSQPPTPMRSCPAPHH
ncbi:mucin-12-like [Portunus trituberculatus]|uniref:mucin-12-like n=1 Tax=Portunus trituberculatus TaxID=210409 RepID=UPI001E1CE174|nr:mucin-12-like [Portunus trituberculatus]